MNTSPEPDARQHEARIVELEMLLTHQQRLLSDLDHVVLAQQKQIEALEQHVRRLRAELDHWATAAPEVRSPEEEKPPHY